MDDTHELRELELDALREVANIGAGHAATALSQLTSQRIMINVPQLHALPLDQVPGLLGPSDQIVAAVLMHMLGDLTGRMLFMVPEPDARRLCDILLRRDQGTTTAFGDLERSSLKEAANILGGAYMSALSDFLGMMLLPSVPSLEVDTAAAVLSTAYLSFGRDRDVVICVETDFQFEGSSNSLRGYVLLLPDVASLNTIFDAIRVH